jgi:hypothetical protein
MYSSRLGQAPEMSLPPQSSLSGWASRSVRCSQTTIITIRVGDTAESTTADIRGIRMVMFIVRCMGPVGGRRRTTGRHRAIPITGPHRTTTTVTGTTIVPVAAIIVLQMEAARRMAAIRVVAPLVVDRLQGTVDVPQMEGIQVTVAVRLTAVATIIVRRGMAEVTTSRQTTVGETTLARLATAADTTNLPMAAMATSRDSVGTARAMAALRGITSPATAETRETVRAMETELAPHLTAAMDQEEAKRGLLLEEISLDRLLAGIKFVRLRVETSSNVRLTLSRRVLREEARVQLGQRSSRARPPRRDLNQLDRPQPLGVVISQAGQPTQPVSVERRAPAGGEDE